MHAVHGLVQDYGISITNALEIYTLVNWAVIASGNGLLPVHWQCQTII